MYILSKKNVKTSKDLFFEQILKSKDNLEDCNVSDIYKKVLKHRKDLDLKDIIIKSVLECEDISNLDLLPFVNLILQQKKEKSKDFLNLRELSILNLINSDRELLNFDYIKIFSKLLDNRKKNHIKLTEKEDLLIRVVGTSNELDNLRLDDKLL